MSEVMTLRTKSQMTKCKMAIFLDGFSNYNLRNKLTIPKEFIFFLNEYQHVLCDSIGCLSFKHGTITFVGLLKWISNLRVYRKG